MASTVIPSGLSSTSNYSSRRVTLQVTGGISQETTRLGFYTLTIPYSSLSQTLQRIHRQGGTVTSVAMSDSGKTFTLPQSAERASSAESAAGSTNANTASNGKKGTSRG
jgi:CpcD/allophycocyanin linker domain